MLSAMSVTVKPTVNAVSEQGLIQLIYWQKPFNSTLASNFTAILPSGVLQQQPFYQVKSVRKGDELRAIRLPAASD